MIIFQLPAEGKRKQLWNVRMKKNDFEEKGNMHLRVKILIVMFEQKLRVLICI